MGRRGVVEVFGHERVPGAVPGEHVAASAEDDRGHALTQRGQQSGHAGCEDFGFGLAESGEAGAVREVVQMRRLGIIQPKHAG